MNARRYTTAQVRAPHVEGQVAKINGTWSFVSGVYSTDDLDDLAGEMDAASVEKVTDIIRTGMSDGFTPMYVAVAYLYTHVQSYPGPDFRRDPSIPKWAIAAYSVYELIEIQVPIGEN